jgi:hypothetical protein
MIVSLRLGLGLGLEEQVIPYLVARSQSTLDILYKPILLIYIQKEHILNSLYKIACRNNNPKYRFPSKH